MTSRPATEPVPAEAPASSFRAISRRLTAEIWIVLGLSLGQSAIYAIVSLIAKLTQGPLKGQATAINTSASPREWLDLTYQILGICFALIPVALALYLLSASGRSALRQLGVDRTQPVKDALGGVALAALIGVPGIAFYALGRAVGITVQVQAAGLGDYWWSVPVLILLALKNAVIEEVIVVGYLFVRLRELRWRTPAIFAASALLRGSYHLYQGIGPFFGNVVMGLVFAEWYRRTRRVTSLVVAHWVMDIVAFVGYALLPASIRAMLGMN